MPFNKGRKVIAFLIPVLCSMVLITNAQPSPAKPSKDTFPLQAGLPANNEIVKKQRLVSARIIDAITKEPIEGASITCNQSCQCGCSSDAEGSFKLNCNHCDHLTISRVGYEPFKFDINNPVSLIRLEARSSLLEDVVISANRGAIAKRSETPIAIAQLSAKTIQETRAISFDQLLNKISGVNMVDLGNEQHQMSIRQPMTTKSLFLYLEDGIPVRTTGLYNHNALLEMNMSAMRSVEVIKGPSSALYGSEAIGGAVNIITQSPTLLPLLKFSLQGNNIGYKKAELQSSFMKGKFGMSISGYYAKRNNNAMNYSDFDKSAFTIRTDYAIGSKTKIWNSLTYINYYSDMPGGVDSAMFASKKFINPQTFTYRAVKALRNHLTLKHQWNDDASSSISLVYRNNSIAQNPAYRIKDDYRRLNGVWRGDKTLAHGEINESSFNSYGFIAQHKQELNWKKASITSGLSMDLSPSTYYAEYIRIQKDTLLKKYTGYIAPDSLLTNYSTRINNYAAFVQASFSPAEKLNIVASLRYDLFHYRFNNALVPSSFSGAADTTNRFSKLSSKIGFTYNPSSVIGFYANYSEGFVPPQVTEMYTGVKVPSLEPSVFFNYEAGGWFALIKNKLSADFSIYLLKGTNEIVSSRLDDGSFANQNAGRTIHKGIEFSLNATPVKPLNLRISGAFSKHHFEEFIEKGISYNGMEMNNAPSLLLNAELWYRPAFFAGFRIGAELQKVGKYYTDPQNTDIYNGYYTINLRTGYKWKWAEAWMNIMNLTNQYYSNITSKSSFGYSYRLADPINFNIGLSIQVSDFFKEKKSSR